MKRCPNCNFPNIDSDRICFKCGTALLEEAPTLETLSNQTDETTQDEETAHTNSSSQDGQSSHLNEPIQTSQPTHFDSFLHTNQTLNHGQSTGENQALHTDLPSQLNPTLHTSQPSQPKIKGNTDDLVVKPNPVFDTNTNISAFIHKPTDTTGVNPKTTPTMSSRPIPSPKVSPTNNKATSEVAATSIPLPTMPAPPLATSSPSLPTPARILPKYKSLARLKTLSTLMGILFGLALIAVGVLFIFVYPGLLGVASCIGFAGMGLISIFLGFVLSAVLGWLNDVECNQRKQIELINHVYHKIED